jgi:hypothetical protein
MEVKDLSPKLLQLLKVVQRDCLVEYTKTVFAPWY